VKTKKRNGEKNSVVGFEPGMSWHHGQHTTESLANNLTWSLIHIWLLKLTLA